MKKIIIRVAILILLSISIASITGWIKTGQELNWTRERLDSALETEWAYFEQNKELQKELDAVRGARDFAQQQEDVAYGHLETAFAELREVRENLAATQEELSLGIIVGRVYIDNNFNGALENYPDNPLKGLKVNLCRNETDNETGKISGIVLATTETDKQGMYQFKVAPGEYYVVPITYIDGYPGWGLQIWLKPPGYIQIAENEIKLGPIFMVSNPTNEKG